MKVNYISTNWTYETLLGRGGGMFVPYLKFKPLFKVARVGVTITNQADFF